MAKLWLPVIGPAVIPCRYPSFDTFRENFWLCLTTKTSGSNWNLFFFALCFELHLKISVIFSQIFIRPQWESRKMFRCSAKYHRFADIWGLVAELLRWWKFAGIYVMHLSMSCPNRGRAVIHRCVARVWGKWAIIDTEVSLGVGLLTFLVEKDWERVIVHTREELARRPTERAELQNGGIRGDGGWVDSKKCKTLHVFLLLQNTEFWILSCFRN